MGFLDAGQCLSQSFEYIAFVGIEAVTVVDVVVNIVTGITTLTVTILLVDSNIASGKSLFSVHPRELGKRHAWQRRQ